MCGRLNLSGYAKLSVFALVALLLIGTENSLLVRSSWGQEATTDEKQETPKSDRKSEKATSSKKQKRKNATQKKPANTISLPFPEKAPDGRQLVPFVFFQSQLSPVVPNDYRAVSVDRLREALENGAPSNNDENSIRIKKSFYDVRLVGRTLFSERSVIDIEKDVPDTVRRSLGAVNLALSAPKNRFASPIDSAPNLSQPRFESDASGELLAVFPGDQTSSSISFGWSLQGKQNGIYRDFQLALPSSPLSQIVVSTPSDTVLTCEDGVLRSWPSPPPGAELDSRSNDVRWYTIEAGGLSARDKTGLSIVNLRASQEKDLLNATAFVVREESRQYEIDSSGVNWWHVMRVQSEGGRDMPELELASGVVTSVRIANNNLNSVAFGQGVERRFKTTTQADGSTIIRINEPLTGEASDNVVVTITIAGKSSWDGASGWCDFPTTRWIDQNVIDAQSTSRTQVTVRKPLKVVGWELPPNWTQKPEQTILGPNSPDQESILLQSEGPALSHCADDLTDDVIRNQPWSRMRLVKDSSITSSAHLLQLKVDNDQTIAAKSRLELVIDQNRASPIPLKIEPSWNLQSVTLVHSGRVIESPSIDRTRTLRIWPEPGDVIGRSLVIETRGTRDLQMVRNRTDVPSTVFLQIDGVHSETLTAVVPPPELNWAGDTALRGQRLGPESLSDDQIVFFDAITEESLLFRPDANATPSLSLRRPGVSFDVSTSLRFDRFGDEVLETLSVSTQSASQLLRTIEVDSGPALSRPEYRWSLRSDDESLPINLPSTAIDLNARGQYEVNIGESSMRNRRLVGSRRYKIDTPITLQCPSVPKAASQNAQVILGPGLQLNKRDPSVAQLVPVETIGTAAVIETQSDDNDTQSSFCNIKSESAQSGDAIRLRYDATKKTRLVIQKTDSDPSLGIVWQQELDITASSRGTDLIRGLFRVSSSRPIKIDYEPDLQLTTILHNGVSIDLNTISQNPIVLTPRSDTDVIRVSWTRGESKSQWVRRCHIPRIQMDGVLLKSSYQLIPSVDTFAIASLAHNSVRGNYESRAIDVVAGTVQSLTPRNLSISFGWLIAAILFVATWVVAKRSLLAVAMVVTLTSFAAVLWWPWQLAIVGWCVVPTLAAALLETSLRWSNPKTIDPAIDTQDKSLDDSPSEEFSLLSKLFVGMLAAVLASFSNTPATAQETSGKHINVLVPANKKMEQVGDKVYIPIDFYQQLFDTRRDEAPSPVLFESAIYRVDLESVRESIASGESPTINAEFVVSPNRPSSRIQLPFPKNVVERIELTDGEQDRIFFAEFDTETTSIVALPSDDLLRLQITLLPNIVSTGETKRLQLDIPKVGSARVLVEADRSIETVDVVGSRGAVAKQPGLRRWEAELGPVGRLNLEYQEAKDEADANKRSLKRRYLIKVGERRTSIDCQIEPSQATLVGDSIQLVVLDSVLPKVTSPAWRLDATEMITASRRLITLTRRSGFASAKDQSAIHLLWSVPSTISDLSLAENRIPVSIPDVIPPASGEYDPAWVAIQHDTRVQVTMEDDEVLTELSDSQFRSAWSGIPAQGDIDQAFVCTDDLPGFLITQVSSDELTSEDVSHHLHVMNDHMQLRFRATIVPGNSPVKQNSLRIPKDLDLIRVTLNGQPIQHTVISSESYSEIPIGDFSGSESITVETLGLLPRPKSNTLELPTTLLWPSGAKQGTYTLTHSDDVRLKIVRQPKGLTSIPMTSSASEMLANGWIPEASWRFDQGDQDPETNTLGGLIRVNPRKVTLDCNQSIRMNYRDGEWSMRVEIGFRNTKILDFVDVEIPTRWCKELVIGPTVSWTQQQSTNPEQQVIRIVCDPDALESTPLVISSQLDTSDQGRVDAPRLRVLGAKTKISVTVPNRLTNAPIEWIAKAVSVSAEDSGDLFSTYEVQNAFAWSMELAPLSDAESDPVALASDAQVFLQNNKTLLICRWDIVPNRLNSVVVRLPKDATCLGAWAAGKPIRFTPIDAASDEQSENIRIPFSLSRLAQSVEVLLSIPTLNAKRADYLPELREIFVPDQWVSVYTPSDAAELEKKLLNRKDQRSYALSQKRGIALASVVVEAIDQSLDTLAERPANEVATWLLPWIARYRNIAASVNRPFHFFDRNAADDADDMGVGESPDRVNVMAELGQLKNANTADHDRLWRILDRRMRAHINRLLDDGHLNKIGEFDPLFDAGNYNGYRLSDVTKITPAVSPRPIQSMSAGMHNLRQILINILTLAMVTGTLVIFKPFRSLLGRLATHPSFWLALVGCFGLLVAPIPVAIAVIVVALTLPWWTQETVSTGR